MRQPQAPSIMQRFVQALAAVLHRRHGMSMVAYWLLFGPNLPAKDILQNLAELGITTNTNISILQPTSTLIYLGLHLDAPRRNFAPTEAYIQHLLQLLSLLRAATRHDLRRTVGYATWLAWAGGPSLQPWHSTPNIPTGCSSCTTDSSSVNRDACNSRLEAGSPTPTQPLRSQPDSTWALLRISAASTFDDQRPTAFAELVAALHTHNWAATRHQQPTTFTLSTEFSLANHCLPTGKDLPLHQNELLKQVYVT